MPKRISGALGVSHEALDGIGVFDRFVDIDSQLHVDPHLLATSTAPELRSAAGTLETYWQDTILILRNIFEYGDRFWREALQRFTFPEDTSIGLGYAKAGTEGAAVGRVIAERLVKTAGEIVRAGILDPKIFELVGLFEPNVGPDLISDMTVHIIEQHILQFTERVCSDLHIPTKALTIANQTFLLPIAPSSGRRLSFLPKDILLDLPVAFSWQDIDKVCMYNEGLRARLNSMIGENWRRATADLDKQKLRQALIENPGGFADLLKQYRDKKPIPYDFAKDVLGETMWFEEAQKAALAFPLDLSADGPATPATLTSIVQKICGHFRHLVENCGLSRVFWTDDHQVRHERVAQLLFFGVADAYCQANNIDLSPEVNSGRGPVDFKLSKGYDARSLVEVKWSKNPKLVHGYETQLTEYAKAESTLETLFLVIQVTESTTNIDKIQLLKRAARRAGRQTPEVVVVDGRIKESASHFNE